MQTDKGTTLRQAVGCVGLSQPSAGDIDCGSLRIDGQREGNSERGVARSRGSQIHRHVCRVNWSPNQLDSLIVYGRGITPSGDGGSMHQNGSAWICQQ